MIYFIVSLQVLLGLLLTFILGENGQIIMKVAYFLSEIVAPIVNLLLGLNLLFLFYYQARIKAN